MIFVLLHKCITILLVVGTILGFQIVILLLDLANSNTIGFLVSIPLLLDIC